MNKHNLIIVSCCPLIDHVFEDQRALGCTLIAKNLSTAKFNCGNVCRNKLSASYTLRNRQHRKTMNLQIPLDQFESLFVLFCMINRHPRVPCYKVVTKTYSNSYYNIVAHSFYRSVFITTVLIRINSFVFGHGNGHKEKGILHHIEYPIIKRSLVQKWSHYSHVTLFD